MKYYLIDFDNVNTKKDLKAWASFTDDYYIYLFYTPEKSKVDVEIIDEIGEAKLKYVKVPAGNQSLDMHLVSLLGYLIAKDPKGEFFIVSNDSDYKNIKTYWTEKEGIAVNIIPKIGSITQETKSKTKKAAEPKKESPKASKKSEKKKAPDAKTQLNGDIQKALAKAKYSQKKIKEITAIVMEHYGEAKCASVIHDALGKKFTDFRDIYDVIKPVISKTGSAVKASSKVRPSEDIRAVLKKSKRDADVINYVGNLIDSHYGEDGWKQTVYRAIIKKYGQAQGLDLYRNIKNHLK